MDPAQAVTARESSQPDRLRRVQALLSCTLLGLSIADLIITRFLVENQFAMEGNPLLRGHISDAGFGALKIAGTLLAVLLLADIFRRHREFTVNVTAMITAFYTLLVWWNVSLALRGIFR
jgi:hypothetical protein